MSDSDAPELQAIRIFKTLLAHDVDFVLVGGSAAQLHGATWSTGDVDICIDLGEEDLSAPATR